MSMWKHIFNTAQHCTLWRSRDAAAKAASEAGYRFMSWNGGLLFVAVDGGVHETGITIEEVEHNFITQDWQVRFAPNYEGMT